MKIIVLLLLSLSLFPGKAHAETFGLEITPDSTQLYVLPGATESVSYTLTNVSDETSTYTADFYEFRPNDSGDRRIRLSSGKSLKMSRPYIAQYFSLTQNGTPINEVTLNPGDTEKVMLNITIPKEAVQEDLYISLMFTGAEASETGSQIVGAVASNILMTIGDPRPILTLTEFTTSSFYWGGPINFTLEVLNSGKNLTSTDATITIHNMFGVQVGEIKTDPVTILAESSRTLTQNGDKNITWSPRFLFGRYTATADVSAGEGEPQTVSFIVIPLLPILAVIICLSFIIGIYLRVKRKL